MLSAPTLCPTRLAHLENKWWPLDAEVGAQAQEDGKSGPLREDEKTEQSNLSEMRSESGR